MSRLLVTGGAGFIGANFVRFWRARHCGDEITVLDALTYAGNLVNLDGVADVAFVHGDIRDEALVRDLLLDRRIDTLVHFAAESHVDRSIRNSRTFVETNVLGAQSLLDAAKAVWLDAGSGAPHRFHNVSTDEVFGSLGPDDPPFREDTPFAPNSPYSASKAAADHLVRAYHRTYGLQTTTSFCSNNYGPYQFPEKLIPLFLINSLEGLPLPLYGDGGNVRDWLHVEDHCRALELILGAGTAGESYAVGGGRELPNTEITQTLCAVVDDLFENEPTLRARFPRAPAAQGLGSADLITPVADRLGHDRRYAIDSSRIGRELGYAPAHAFEASLAATVRWYLDNEVWWRNLMARPPGPRPLSPS